MIIRKILKSLPERFRPNVTTIEEGKDINTLIMEELVGSLQTSEMTFKTNVKFYKKNAKNFRRNFSLGNDS